MGQRLGSTIGAIGGVLFVLINAGALGSPAGTVVRVAGVVGFAVTIWFAVLRARPPAPESRPSPAAVRVYWLCVLGEVIAIPIGAQVLVRVLGRGELTLAWVVFVVGVHFLPFARAFRVPLFIVLGLTLMAVAVTGAAVAVVADPRGPAWAAIAAGFVLLGFAFAGGTSRRPSDATG